MADNYRVNNSFSIYCMWERKVIPYKGKLITFALTVVNWKFMACASEGETDILYF